MFKLAFFVMLSLLSGSVAASPIGLCGTGSADCQLPTVFSWGAASLRYVLVMVPPPVGPNGVTGPVYFTQAGIGGSTEKGDWTSIYETAFNMHSGFVSSELLAGATYAVPDPHASADEVPKVISCGILGLGLLAIWWPEDPGNPTVDFHGEKRSNETHESTTDPDGLLARKGSGKEAKLSYNGNLLTKNRNGFIITTEVFQANGTAERDACLVMLEQIPGGHRVTVGADKLQAGTSHDPKEHGVPAGVETSPG